MEEDISNPKKMPRTFENTELYPAIVINDGRDTPSTNTDKPTKLALIETQQAYFRKLRNIQDKAMRYYLHLEYLKKYIVPKGLKISIEPFLGKNDKNLHKECNGTITGASLNGCMSQFRRFSIPKVLKSEGSQFRRFSIPKVLKSEGS